MGIKHKSTKPKVVKPKNIVMAIDGGNVVPKPVKEYVEGVVLGRNDYQPKVRELLDKFGDETIKSITVLRTPIMKVFEKLLNTLSGGELKKQMEKMNYDELFHLRLLVKTDKNNRIAFEKNETINAIHKFKIPPNTDKLEVTNIPTGLTINQLLTNTKKRMGKKFFPYSGVNNNCQDFVLNILQANNLATTSAEQFIKQDTQTLFNTMPVLKKVMDALTGFAERAGVAVVGTGMDDECKCIDCPLCKTANAIYIKK
jgi:inorganic pyrophosphatase/exopolyphosphatase